MNKIYNNYFLIGFTFMSILLVSYGTYIDFNNIAHFSINNFFKIIIAYAASILGIIFIVLEVKAFKSMFIIGIIGSVCSVIYLFIWSPLLWDMSIAFIYIILNIYGLYYWNTSDRDKNHHIIIKTLTRKESIFYSIITIFSIALLSYLGIKLGKYHSELQAITDAVTTVLAILAQWLVSKKYLEMWYIWIIVNIISIPLYISIHAYSYVTVYICYLGISIYGLYYWKKYIVTLDNKVFN